MFSDANTGAQITDGATRFVDLEWHTWTSTLGWSVIGIWSGSMDGSDVNNVDRSPSGKYLATCDDFGKVNIFQYPSIQEKGSMHNSYSGHSSHVTNVRWASSSSVGKKKRISGKSALNDDYLISVGGEDKCIFQWKHEDSKAAPDVAMEDDAEENAVAPDDVDVDFDLPTGGDEFMAVKPWLGAIVAPTVWTNPAQQKLPPFFAALTEYGNQLRNFKGAEGEYQELEDSAKSTLQAMYESGYCDPSPPDNDELELEHVHGYRGFDCRNNVFYITLSNKKKYVLYYAAALGVLMDPKEKVQKYFRGHTDDIISMAVYSPQSASSTSDQIIVASGQQGISSVYIWEVPSLQTISVINTKQKNIHSMAFSSDGRLVVSLAQDHSIAVVDWKSSSILATAKTDNSNILDTAVFTSTINASAGNSSVQFITVGEKVLRLWTINGRNISSTKYLTSSDSAKGKIQSYLSVREIAGCFFVGCEDGSIYAIPLGTNAVQFIFPNPSAKTEGVADKKGGKKAAGGAGGDKNSISAMTTFSKDSMSLLLTGAKDGTINIFDVSMDAGKVRLPLKLGFSVEQHLPAHLSIMAKQIQALSICSAVDGEGFCLIVGTRGCDLLEFHIDKDWKAVSFHDENATSPNYSGILTRGHCNEEVWGIATHPHVPVYCTTGDDKTLRFYDIPSKLMTHVVTLGHISRTVCYSPNGKLVALGFGGRVGKGKESGGGLVRIYSAPTSSKPSSEVKKLCERQDAKQWISDIKFSSNGNTLVAGAHDCKIYIYNVAADGAEISLRATFNKHNSVINHLDLSQDGRYMQSNCSAYELLFADTLTGKQITSASELRDVKWESWTCTLGWPVQGIWAQGNMDGSDINAVHRSHTGHLLATSDDFGKVNLFRYPVSDSKASKCIPYSGHSSHVMNVRWTCGDECLISVGGNDKCVFQWRHRVSDASFGGSSASSTSKKQPAPLKAVDTDDEDGEDGGAFGDGPSGGDESGAVKPWLGAVRAPKCPPPTSNQAPAVDIALQWVHGFSTSTSSHRNNLCYNAEDQLLFPAAALGILLQRPTSTGSANAVHESSNKATWQQKYLSGHDDDILCVTMSKDRRYFATGQIASKALKGKASVIVWDALQGRQLTKMEGCHQRGVLSLAFNEEGNQLVSVGMDDSFTHILWKDLGGNWSRVQAISNAKGDKQPTLFLSWLSPQHAMSSECHFISGGLRSMSLWKVEGSSLVKKQARLGKKISAAAYLCMVNIPNKEKTAFNVFFGSSTGDILTLQDREIQIAVEKAHDKGVQSLAVIQPQANDGGDSSAALLISGGKDGCVKIWNPSLQMISILDLKSPSFDCFFDASVAAIDVKPFSSNEKLVFVVGTLGGDVVEFFVPSSKGKDSDSYDLSKAQVSPLMTSHSKGELWGLATNPIYPDIYATVGDDQALRIWSMKKNCCLATEKLPKPSRSICWHPDGHVLAVAFEEVKGSGKGGKGGKSKGGKAKEASGGGKGKGKSKSKEAADEEENDGSSNMYQTEDDADGKQSSDTASSEDKMKAGVFIYSSAFSRGSDEEATLTLRAWGCYSPAGGKGSTGLQSFPSIVDIKFSPCKNILFIAPKDTKLYGYEVPAVANLDASKSEWQEWSARLKSHKYFFKAHTSMITHFDCSMDGKYIQSNDLGNELLFYDIEANKQETSATKLADYNGVLPDDDNDDPPAIWGTQNCVFGWPVQGIWPPNSYDSSEINSVDRDVRRKYLATAEDSGIVRVLRFPSITPNSSAVTLRGHSSHVTNVRWTIENQLVSVGGNDKCVFVWNMVEK